MMTDPGSVGAFSFGRAELSGVRPSMSQEQLRESFALSNRDFDSTTAGMHLTVKAWFVNGRTCGGKAPSPRAHRASLFVTIR